jgi:methylated-DNA-[protein]-cysteine S-methyltransferase
MTGFDPTTSDGEERLARRLRSSAGTEVGETVSALRAGLAERAAVAELLDVAYRVLDTPVGPLLLAATPTGLVRVAYAIHGHDRALAHLAERVSPRLLHSPRQLDPAARQIEEYFARRRRHFDIPLDFQLTRGFRRIVLDRLLDIDYASTASYATVAAMAASPKAVRAVGTACATNPLPIVVPCHRVVRSDGTLGGYAGGVDVKKVLLQMEATTGP